MLISWPNSDEKDKKIMQRIQRNVDQHNECLIWKTNQMRAPEIKIQGKQVSLRHYVYDKYFGIVRHKDKTIFVVTTCRNVLCISPVHLRMLPRWKCNMLRYVGWEYEDLSDEALINVYYKKRLLDGGTVDTNTGCRIWKNIVGKTKYYGEVNYLGKKWLVHRLSWKLHYGDIPEGQIVRHKCKSKLCYNIEHLELGTQKENILDQIRDGTMRRGENHPSAKLSEETVRGILHSKKSCKLIADENNISKSTVSHIRKGDCWGHLHYSGVNPKLQRKRIEAMKKRTVTRSDYQNWWDRASKKAKRQKDCLCLPLAKSDKKRGYVNIGFKSHTRRAHIVSWEYHHGGAIEGSGKGKVVRHLCGTKNCIEPSHLKIGTHEENSADKKNQGTQNGISDEKAKEIYELKGIMENRDIATKFDVTYACVWQIINKKSHKVIHTTIS